MPLGIPIRITRFSVSQCGRSRCQNRRKPAAAADQHEELNHPPGDVRDDRSGRDPVETEPRQPARAVRQRVAEEHVHDVHDDPSRSRG
jgi:hypothetical protein